MTQINVTPVPKAPWERNFNIEPSFIRFPVRFRLDGLARLLNTQVSQSAHMFGPGAERNQGPPDPDHFWAEVPSFSPRSQFRYLVERDQFSVSFSGGISASVPVKYAIRARSWIDAGLFSHWQNASCGCNDEAWCNGDDGAPRRAVISVRSPISILPSWRFASLFEQVDSVRVDTVDSCELSFLGNLAKVDITNRVRTVMESMVRAQALALDARIESTTVLVDRARALWNALVQPREISPGVWFVLRPQGVSYGGVEGGDVGFTIHVSIGAEPVITSSAVPPDAGEGSLPDLGTVPHGGGVHLAAPVRISMSVIEDAIKQAVVGRRYPPVGPSVEIRDIGLYGYRGKLAMKVTVSGEFTGDLYMVGQLDYNGLSREIVLASVQLSPEAGVALDAAGGWPDAGEAANGIRDSVRIPIGDELDHARERLTQALNQDMGDGIRLSGTADSIRIVDIGVDGDFLEAGVVLDASASVEIDALVL